jgi:hypothetical protein
MEIFMVTPEMLKAMEERKKELADAEKKKELVLDNLLDSLGIDPKDLHADEVLDTSIAWTNAFKYQMHNVDLQNPSLVPVIREGLDPAQLVAKEKNGEFPFLERYRRMYVDDDDLVSEGMFADGLVALMLPLYSPDDCNIVVDLVTASEKGGNQMFYSFEFSINKGDHILYVPLGKKGLRGALIEEVRIHSGAMYRGRVGNELTPTGGVPPYAATRQLNAKTVPVYVERIILRFLKSVYKKNHIDPAVDEKSDEKPLSGPQVDLPVGPEGGISVNIAGSALTVQDTVNGGPVRRSSGKSVGGIDMAGLDVPADQVPVKSAQPLDNKKLLSIAYEVKGRKPVVSYTAFLAQ